MITRKTCEQRKRQNRLLCGMLVFLLAMAMIPLAGTTAGAVVSIDQVSLVMDEAMMPVDGAAIPQYSMETSPNALRVRPAEGETGYTVSQSFWNSSGTQADAGEAATGTFKEGNTYWIYVCLRTEEAAFLPGSMMTIRLNGRVVHGNTDSWSDRLSFFLPVTLGEQKIWTVRLEANGHGTVSTEELEVPGGSSILEDSGEEVTCTADDGYDFTGWYREADCIHRVDALETMPVYEDMTLYAGWNPKPELHAITGISLDGDILTWDPVAGARGYDLDYMIDGKRFSGKYVSTSQVNLIHELEWFGNTGGGDVPYGECTITITAFGEAYDPDTGNGQLSLRTPAGVYEYRNPDDGQDEPDPEPDPVTFRISFDASGGTGTMEALRVEEGSAYLLPECAFEAPENRNFQGWATSPDDDTLYQPGDTLEITGDTVFFARWQEPEPVNPFEDLNPDAYYFRPVLWAVSRGITTGTSETTFEPGTSCTRAQIVTFLWRNAGEPEPLQKANPFKDVQKTDYFYKAVLWAVERNITQGTSAITFEPWTGCTRGQVVTFLHRDAGKPAVQSSRSSFEDVAPDAFYAQAVLWAVEKNITQGTSPVTFVPDEICARGQIVTFLYRAAQNA